MISMAMLHDAQRVLKPVINRTPVIPTKGLVPGCDFYLKADCLQKTGAFKLRGAYYKIATLSDEEKARGVIACSAGNHAQGVAYAARDMGIKATICIPEGAPISKIEATRSYGANVVLVPGVYDDAYAEAVRLRDEQGLTFIHPFNDYRIMAGQGTIGLEILEQLPDVDMIFVPIGGGGLIAGLAYAVKNLKPDCRIVGVQAAGAPSMAESLKEGKIITLSSVDTVADGIKVKTPGDLTFDMCREYVDEVVTVSEGEIASAILTGRTVSFSTVLPDQPHALASFLEVVSSMGANVLDVNHERRNTKAAIGSCVVNLSVETRDKAHIQELFGCLRRKGYVVEEQ